MCSIMWKHDEKIWRSLRGHQIKDASFQWPKKQLWKLRSSLLWKWAVHLSPVHHLGNKLWFWGIPSLKWNKKKHLIAIKRYGLHLDFKNAGVGKPPSIKAILPIQCRNPNKSTSNLSLLWSSHKKRDPTAWIISFTVTIILRGFFFLKSTKICLLVA